MSAALAHIPPALLRNKRLGMKRAGYCSWLYRGVIIRRMGRTYTVEPYGDITIGVTRFDRLWKARELADWLADAREGWMPRKVGMR